MTSTYKNLNKKTGSGNVYSTKVNVEKEYPFYGSFSSKKKFFDELFEEIPQEYHETLDVYHDIRDSYGDYEIYTAVSYTRDATEDEVIKYKRKEDLRNQAYLDRLNRELEQAKARIRS